jgi:hypothetical protein
MRKRKKTSRKEEKGNEKEVKEGKDNEKGRKR